MNLTVSAKINLGYLFMVVLIVMASASGYYGASTLSGTLKFVTGKAWNAADGAMEGTIGIQKQMIEMTKIISDRSSAAEVAKGREGLAAAKSFAVDRAFPDPAAVLRSGEWVSRSMRWSVSSLLIAFPLFVYISYRLKRAFRQDPAGRASKIRKWLTYMTLFIAASTIIVDLITLVFNVLGGELTTRFVLKIVVVGAIAGAIFGDYLWDLSREEREQ